MLSYRETQKKRTNFFHNKRVLEDMASKSFYNQKLDLYWMLN